MSDARPNQKREVEEEAEPQSSQNELNPRMPISKKLLQLYVELENEETDVVSLKNKLDEINLSNDRLKNKVASLQNELENVSQKLVLEEAKTTALEVKVKDSDGMKEQLALREKEVANLKASLNEREAEVRVMCTDADGLKSALKSEKEANRKAEFVWGFFRSFANSGLIPQSPNDTAERKVGDEIRTFVMKNFDQFITEENKEVASQGVGHVGGHRAQDDSNPNRQSQPGIAITKAEKRKRPSDRDTGNGRAASKTQKSTK